MEWKRWVEVRRDERRSVGVTFATLFAIVAGHSILETARDALFLAKLPASQLPIAYFAIAVLVVFVGQATGWLRGRVARVALLPVALISSGLLTAVFWLGLNREQTALLYVLYVWSGLVGTFVVGLFWIRVGDIFDVGQAKRVFPLVGIGGVAGATVGSLSAGFLLSYVEPSYLILAAASVYVAAGCWVVVSWSRSGSGENDSDYDRRSERMTRLEILRREPYLRRLSVLIALSMVTVTVVDYLFKSAVATNIPSDELGSFFASYYAAINAISAVVQILIAPALLSYLGVNRTLVLFPALLIAGSLGLVLSGGMTVALILKGVDGSLRHSLYRTGMEILYLPLSSDIRGRFKTVLDGIAQRGGQAVASLAIIGYSMLEYGTSGLAIAVLALSTIWMVLGLRMRRGYLDLFRDRLSSGRIDARADIPDLDLSALEQLLRALNSQDDDTVIAALSMFSLYRRSHIVPALILYHPSSRVVGKAADVLSQTDRVDVSGVAGRLVSSPDPAIRASALRLIVSDPEQFRDLQEGVEVRDDPVIRGMLVLGRFNVGELGEDEAKRELSEVFREASAEALCGLAQAMRANTSSVAMWALVEMASLGQPELCSEVSRSMAEVPHSSYLPTLVHMLGLRIARPEARRALVALGDEALRYLEEAALQGELQRRVLRHIPRSISPFRGQRAVDSLVRMYQQIEEGYVRFKVLRALGRLLADDPKLSIDTQFLESQLEACLRRMILMIDCRASAMALRSRRRRYQHPAMDLLIDTLRGKESNAMERFFRFLAIRHPRENIHVVFKGLMSEDSRVRAGSRELLDNVIEGSYRFAARALVDDLTDRDKLARAAYYFDPSAGFNPLDVEASFMLRLRGMLGSSSETIRLVSDYVVEQLGLDPDAHEEGYDNALDPDLFAQPERA